MKFNVHTYEKNDFLEIFKNLARYRFKNNFVLIVQNNVK